MKKYWIIRQQAKSPKVLELYIYGEIQGNHYDWLTDQVVESETSAEYIRKEIAAFGDISRLELHINSFGGSVYEGNAIANMIRRLGQKCETVAYIDAFACSAASVIACACKNVIMPRNTVLMIHNPWQIAIGNAKELRKAADDLDVLGAAFRTIYLDKAGDKLTEDKLVELLDAETYLTAEQAHEIGLCDEIEEFDAIMQEPDDDTKGSAAKAHINLDKLCAMVRSKPELTPDPEPEPEPQAKAEPEPEPVKPEPDATKAESEHAAFLEKVDDLISNFIK